MEHTKLSNPLEGARRISVVGCGGAGKSTFSKRLGEILDLPVVHLDSFFWKPGWEETPKGEWGRVVGELIAREAWIIDGNYGGTMDARLAASDAAVFLDMPISTCLRRVVGRGLRFAGESRPDMAPGCPERIEWQFLKYVWNYPKTRRPGVLEKLGNLPDDKVSFVLRARFETFCGRSGTGRSEKCEVGSVKNLSDFLLHTSQSGRCFMGDGFRVEQIDHVEVFVPDRHEAARWYERVFGLEIMDGFEEWAEGGGPLMVSSGNSTKLALFEGEPQGGHNPVGFRRTAFRVGGEGFMEFLDRLAELGVHSRTTDHDKAYSVYFPDPYGNDFEVTTYDHGYVSELLR